MARVKRLNGLLRSRDSKPETRTERREEIPDTQDRIVPKTTRELSPFQRVKQAAGDCFLAAEMIPARNPAN